MPAPSRALRRGSAARGHGVRPVLGFTLLEVLAAVAILGIVYTVLADWAIQGLLAEGEARRRLEASTVADHTLTEIETQIESGVSPPLGVNENEEGDFQVRVEVSPLDLRPTTPLPSPSQRTPQPGSQTTTPGPSLLFAAKPGEVSALRRIEVRVTWVEGAGERTVTRTTFAFDRESIAPLLEQLDADAASLAPSTPERES